MAVVVGSQNFDETPGVTGRMQTIGGLVGALIIAPNYCGMLNEPGLLRQSGAASETCEDSPANENALQCMEIFNINSLLL
jgi:hypothetical protein